MKITLLALLTLSSLLTANDSIMINYLKNGLSKNKNIKNLEVKVINKEILHDKKDWSAYVMSISGNEMRGKESRSFSRHSLYFSDGVLVTPDLRNAITDERYKETMAPKFDEKYYSERYHILGNKDAKHKVAIFSDPLCPYCVKYVPKVLNILKKSPKEYSVYYYHLPLGMHPAAKTVVKAYIVIEQQNSPQLDIEKLYAVNISASEQDEQIILNAFNKTFSTKITLKEINTKEIFQDYEKNLEISTDLMVGGTPSLFYDGKKDSIGRFLE